MDELKGGMDRRNRRNRYITPNFRGNGRAGVAVKAASTLRVQFNSNLASLIGNLQLAKDDRTDAC